MLDDAVVSLYTHKVSLQIVVYRYIIETCVALAVDLTDLIELLPECPSYERSHIEVKCRNSLTSMHFVLDCLQGNTSENARSLNSLRRAGLTVACEESVLQDLVQRVLDAGETLGRVVVLVVDMDVIVLYSFLYVL